MTAATQEPLSVRPTAPAGAHPSAALIDQSCRTPLMALFSCGVFWLIVSLLAAILASIKMHAPGMLANAAALTYGRIAAVSSSAWHYGFASQVAVAAALWLFARSGRAVLVAPGGALCGALLWNAGVVLGVCGILAGAGNHFSAYEMPAWTSIILFVAFLLMGLSGLLTFAARSERALFPSIWFLIAAFFVFPWILSVAYLFLGRYPIRGVLEPVIAIWYANNFTMLWLSPIALAVLFYLIPKLSQQPLYNPALAVFGFWMYLPLASISGFQNTPGLPVWMPVLSGVANALLALPAGAFAHAWYQTWAGHNRAKKQKDLASKFVVFSAIGFLLWIALLLVNSCPRMDEVIGLTIFQHGTGAWVNYGFVGMALFAAIYHVVPRLAEVEWPGAKLAKLHFGLTFAGIVLAAGGLLLGGWVQGEGINNPRLPFNDVVRRVIPYVGIYSIGLIVLLLGQLALLGNLIGVCRRCCPCCATSSREVAR